jgi:signal transduction histidine kinase
VDTVTTVARLSRRGARWKEWLEASPGNASTDAAVGRIEALYRTMAASILQHATAVADTALAVTLAGCIVPQLVYWARKEGSGSFVELAIFTTLLVAPLIWRRRFPLSAFAFIAAVALAQWIASLKVAADITLLIYLYTVARRYPMRVGVLAAAVVEVGTLMAAIRWPLTRLWPEAFFLLSGPVAASLLLGVSVRHWRNSLSVLTERAEQLERERDQQARISAAAERTRIAREMHDVVAHSLSVMVTLSDGAALKQAAEPPAWRPS